MERRFKLLRDASGHERRVFGLGSTEVRTGDSAIGFKGHAAVYGRRTWIGPKKWGFWEQVAPGACAKSIADGDDCRFLINHNPDLILARTAATPTPTLRLSEDTVGLVSDADLAPTSYGQDLAISLERGDVTQMSFAFEVTKDTWETLEDGDDLRTIEEVKLWDVSAVTYPAYTDTDASLRTVGFDLLAGRMGIADETQRMRLLHALAGEDPERDLAPALRTAARRLDELATSWEDLDSKEPAEVSEVLRLRHTHRARQLAMQGGTPA